MAARRFTIYALDAEAVTKAAFQCPCCKFKALSRRHLFEICPVCFWEDDGQDEANAERVLGGPNGNLSLRQAQINFEKFSVCDERYKQNVRSPEPDEI